MGDFPPMTADPAPPVTLLEGDHLVVDAMNVIGSRPDGWWRDRPGAIRRLAGQVRALAERASVRVTLVVDGGPVEGLPPGVHGPMEVRYATRSGPDAADDAIVELVAGLGTPVRVVTADAELRARVAALGAGTLGPTALLRLMEY